MFRWTSARALSSGWTEALLFASLALCSGCKGEDAQTSDPSALADARPASPAAEATPPAAQPEQRAELDLLKLSARCDLEHHGLVLDLADPAVESRRGQSLAEDERLKRVTRGAFQFAHLDQMRTKFRVWLPEAIDEAQVTAHVHGQQSERLAIYVDDQRLGSARLPQGKTKVISIRSSKRIEAGVHDLTVSISKKRGRGVGADVGWVRLGPRGVRLEDHPAPRREVLSEVTIGDQRLAAVVLRRDATLRCPIWVPQEGQLSTSVGLWGTGKARANFAVRTGQGERLVLGEEEIVVKKRRKSESDDAHWQPVTLDLSRFAGQAVALELSAPEVAAGARLAFGEPKIFGPKRPDPTVAPTKRVVVVVLSGLGPQHKPPAAVKHGLPLLGPLSRSSTYFARYQVPTTSATGLMATLLTGLEPWEHGIEHEDQTLATDVPTIAEAVEARGGRSAMFTGAATSFSGFGLARGFERFEEFSPKADVAAVAPLQRAQAWLAKRQEHDGPLFLVVHLRGAHPPFDVPQERAAQLAPEEYGGDLDPRRAAIQLSDIRERRSQRRRRMPGEDWERLEALSREALLEQNAALAEFIESLDASDAQQETLLLVLGDVGAGQRPTIPYSDTAPLRRDYLQPLLLARFAGGARAGERSEAPVSTTDITQTIAAALHLEHLDLAERGTDLQSSNLERLLAERPQIAYRFGAYSVNLGGYWLDGQGTGSPRLCEVQLDPACQVDRSPSSPLATRALWLEAWATLHPGLSGPMHAIKRPEDKDLDDLLRVWGVPR